MTELIRGRYEALESIGRGGQAEIVRAMDHQHERQVALKIYDVRDAEEHASVVQEARILLSLRAHPNLPMVRDDFDMDEHHYCIVMDWIEGKNLRQLLREAEDGHLPYKEATGYIQQAAEALDHLHSHDPPIVHGDVKPSNLILTPDGRVVLVDFGISGREDDPSVTKGTTGFLAPEVLAGDASASAADVYGLAATAATLITGAMPMMGKRPRFTRLKRPFAIRLERALRQGLSIDPAKRIQRATMFANHLRSPLRRMFTLRSGRSRLAWSAVAAVIVVAALIGGSLLFGGRDRFVFVPGATQALPTPTPVSPLVQLMRSDARCPQSDLRAYSAKTNERSFERRLIGTPILTIGTSLVEGLRSTCSFSSALVVYETKQSQLPRSTPLIQLPFPGRVSGCVLTDGKWMIGIEGTKTFALELYDTTSGWKQILSQQRSQQRPFGFSGDPNIFCFGSRAAALLSTGSKTVGEVWIADEGEPPAPSRVTADRLHGWNRDGTNVLVSQSGSDPEWVAVSGSNVSQDSFLCPPTTQRVVTADGIRLKALQFKAILSTTKPDPALVTLYDPRDPAAGSWLAFSTSGACYPLDTSLRAPNFRLAWYTPSSIAVIVPRSAAP